MVVNYVLVWKMRQVQEYDTSAPDAKFGKCCITVIQCCVSIPKTRNLNCSRSHWRQLVIPPANIILVHMYTGTDKTLEDYTLNQQHSVVEYYRKELRLTHNKR